MTPEEKSLWLDKIASANIGELRDIIAHLGSIPGACDLIDLCNKNILDLAGADGDY